MQPDATRNAARTAAIAAMLLALPRIALAHHFMGDELPQTFAQGFLSGLGHPLIGLDHAAFIVAAGFLLGWTKRGIQGVVALVAGSLLGAGLHLAGIGLPAAEAAIAVSVILVGGLVMSGRRIAPRWMAGGLALAGALHGHAYAESIFGAEPAPLVAYLLGFSVIQLGIAAGALLMHRRLMADSAGRAKPLSVALGAVVGAIGVAFLASTLVL